MIELKNVSKTYKSKKSTNTEALKDISIKFPETGMVFILGKSGSGKSTLLNVIGGLDKYDKGEIIINGKSTNKFKEKDYDAFRNTYMGFIFQEFNLIEDYSVEQNIKLALELQKKEATDDEIVGCSSRDVMKIFLSESCLMMIVPLIVSMIFSPKIIERINQFMINHGVLQIDMLSFGFFNIIEIVVFMFLIILISNLLLVGKATKMKPIDAILNK